MGPDAARTLNDFEVVETTVRTAVLALAAPVPSASERGIAKRDSTTPWGLIRRRRVRSVPAPPGDAPRRTRTTHLNDSDDERHQAVALFRYGLIADLVHVPLGSPGIGTRRRFADRISMGLPGSSTNG